MGLALCQDGAGLGHDIYQWLGKRNWHGPGRATRDDEKWDLTEVPVHPAA
jgi:hypothetical protein